MHTVVLENAWRSCVMLSTFFYCSIILWFTFESNALNTICIFQSLTRTIFIKSYVPLSKWMKFLSEMNIFHCKFIKTIIHSIFYDHICFHCCIAHGCQASYFELKNMFEIMSFAKIKSHASNTHTNYHSLQQLISIRIQESNNAHRSFHAMLMIM